VARRARAWWPRRHQPAPPTRRLQSKTLKHHPTFPDRFGCIQDARSFCQGFFGWYNHEHYHSGIALLTPADVHHSRRADHHRPGCGAGWRLRRPSRAVRPQATHAAPAARGGMDQQTRRLNGGASAISWLCLTEVDRLRTTFPPLHGRHPSLEEVPQFINVLPVRCLSSALDGAALGGGIVRAGAWVRFAVKPGITGLWQVSGGSILTMQQALDLDVDYVRRRNLALDPATLRRTVPAILRRRDAC
jgi:Bacterial sugar transferase